MIKHLINRKKIRNNLKELFLYNYREASYVTRQRAYIFLWMCFICLFMQLVIIFLHLLSYNDIITIETSPHLLLMIAINSIFFLTIITSLYILKKGHYNAAVNTILFITLLLAEIGCFTKLKIFMESGSNSFVYVMFAIIGFTSMFSTRKIHAAVSIILIMTFTISLIVGTQLYHSNISIYVFSSSFNIYFALIILCSLSYLISFITERALILTELELRKNKELSLNLEKKVEQRTEELKLANDNLIRINKELKKAQQIADADIKMAKKIQQTLFPEKPPLTTEWDIAFDFKAMAGVSGDFYDFYLDNNKLAGVALFDVSGHGVASALITMIGRSIVYRKFNKQNNKPLNKILDSINKNLIEEIGNVDNYLTGLLLRFNSNNSIEYVNAGHPDIYCKKAVSGSIECIKLIDEEYKSSLLGLKDMVLTYNMLQFEINKNDILLLYTDCLLESINIQKNQYGEKNLISAFTNAPDGSAQEVLDFILHDFYTFMNNKPLEDDLTVIVLKKIA